MVYLYTYNNFPIKHYFKSLKSDSWTREETDYMMELVSQFDCRFVLVADRYDYR